MHMKLTNCCNLNVVGYKIIEGLPLSVERDVNALLTQGWQLNGTMHIMTTPAEKTDIVVQCLILVE